ncbi:acyl-CoA synthetase, partial [Brevibacterium paucivorans]
QEEVRYILDHSGAKALIIDAEFLPTIADIADELETVTTIGVITDPHAERPANSPAGSPAGTSPLEVGTPFEDLLAASEATTEPAALDWTVDDENRHICLNY